MPKGLTMSTMTTRFTIRPLYLQVRDMLVERITGGVWRPGSGIPNEVDLSRELGVSVGTVRKALDVMEGEHLVTRRQGRGTFVNDQSSDELAQRFSRLCNQAGGLLPIEVLKSDVKLARANDEECDRLRLRPGEQVIRVMRVQAAGGQRKLLENIAMPESRFPGLTTRAQFPTRIVALSQQFGVLLGRAQEKVRATCATAGIADALGIAAGTALLELDRLVFAIDGKPVEWRSAVCQLAAGDYYSVDMT